MRIAPLALAALLFAGTAAAQEYTPPRITVVGEARPEVTEQSVTAAFMAAKPKCVAEAAKVARVQPESDWQFRQRQDAAFIFCMTEELAGYGLSVIKDAPTGQPQGT